MKTLFLLLFPMLLMASVDTIPPTTVRTDHWTATFSIRYLQRLDTVMISIRQYGILREKVLEFEQERDYWMRRFSVMGKNLELADSMAQAWQMNARDWQTRSEMYQELASVTYDDLHKMYGLVNDCTVLAGDQRKAGFRQGLTWGVIGGLVIGLVTAAIIIK